MVARCWRKPRALAVVFQRDGQPPERLFVDNGRQAVTRVIALLIAHRELQPGDRPTVEAAE